MIPAKMLSESERSGILALPQLIREQDPTHARLGLRRVTTYTGDYRSLCKHHGADWQPNIPDVIASKLNHFCTDVRRLCYIAKAGFGF